MSVQQWIAFSDQAPPRSAALDDPSVTAPDSVLVTNNIKARDRMGRMSHVWFAAPIKCQDGSYVAFTDGDREIIGLTHWMDPLGRAGRPEPEAGEEVRAAVTDDVLRGAQFDAWRADRELWRAAFIDFGLNPDCESEGDEAARVAPSRRADFHRRLLQIAADASR